MRMGGGGRKRAVLNGNEEGVVQMESFWLKKGSSQVQLNSSVAKKVFYKKKRFCFAKKA